MAEIKRIAVSSGKGGVGKTTIAVSLALSLQKEFSGCLYVDCDVEAPNGHLFLNPEFKQTQTVNIPVAAVDREKCKGCGTCVEVCQYHALALIRERIMVFEQLCHGCGSCIRLCPEQALFEKEHAVGEIKTGTGEENILCCQGELKISEPMASPIIRQLKHFAERQQKNIIIYDSPPGASCSVVETLKSMDFALLVTEPTPFGLHDLKQILGVVQTLSIPHAVIINRDGIGDDQVEIYLSQHHIPIWLKIPYDAKIANQVASGGTLLDVDQQYHTQLLNLYQRMITEQDRSDE